MYRKWQFSLYVIILFFGLGLEDTLYSNPVQNTYTKAHLIHDYDTVNPGDTFLIGVELSPKPGWHTYWKNPGDSGLAPRIEWELSEGFMVGEVLFSAPVKLPLSGLVNYGYKKENLLLAKVQVPKNIKTGKLYPLTAKADWLVCEESCVPESAILKTSLYILAPPHQKKSSHYTKIQETYKKLPLSYPMGARFSYNDEIITFEFEQNPFQSKVKVAEFFPLSNGLIDHSATPISKILENEIFIEVPRGFETPKSIEKGVLRVILENGLRYDYDVESQSMHDRIMSPVSTPLSLVTLLFFAFLGGVILNIMPCVFPILSLKIISLVKNEPKERQKQALSYTTGVIVSFLGLAGLLELFKQAGHVVGWGFQRQSPLFILGLTYVFFLVSLNLIGLFSLPEFLLRIPGLSDRVDTRDSATGLGSFFTGVFAVIVATPCTAPFMAVAIGYALSQTLMISFLIFFCLGLGMAFPYLFLSFLPVVARLLPKPGQWMITFKKIISLPMFASMIWLLWVLEKQVSGLGITSSIFGLVAVFILLLLREKKRLTSSKVSLLVSLVFLFYSIYPFYDIIQYSKTQMMARPFFSQSQITDLQKQGRGVFVDVTAAWCITCQVNERTVLNTDTVTQLFKEHNITLLTVDWTNNDPNITTYLKSFDRSGVPLYVFYPFKGDPVILPQVLTESILRSFINK